MPRPAIVDGARRWRALTELAGLSGEIYTPQRLGIARGIAAHLEERVAISAERCMLRGDRQCVRLFTLVEPAG